MRTWNKRKKPKHWTKPKWEIEISEITEVKIYRLISRGIKNKYKFNCIFKLIFSKDNNKPESKLLSTNSYSKLWHSKTVGR